MRNMKVKSSDLAGDLVRLEHDRAEAERTIAALVEDRHRLVIDGTAEQVIDLDHRKSIELTKIEQANARMVPIRAALASEATEAASAARRQAYDTAHRARQDGVDALAEMRRHLAAAATARTRLIEAKRVVGEINLSLPPGCETLVDPEGSHLHRTGSILDRCRFPAPEGF